MKIEGQKGDYAHKALIRSFNKIGFLLTDLYFFEIEEVRKLYPDTEIRWPVDMIDRECVYIPSEEELNEQ